MKRTKRIVALTLALLLCLPLCSCKELDDMRAHHAFLQEDGTVLWNEAVYKLLPEYKEEVYDWYNRSYLAPSLWVTDAGVPVLLSARYGRRMYANQSKEVIDGWMNGGVRMAYCREDCYDRVVAELDSLADEDVFNDYNIAGLALVTSGSSRKYLADLTAEQREALEEICRTVEPVPSNDGKVYFDAVDVFTVDASRELMTYLLQIYRSPDDSYQLIMVGSNEIYIVPESYNSLFDTLMIPFWKSQGMTEDMFPKR